jgi:hypothetical protein
MGDARDRVPWSSKGESEPNSNAVIYWSQAQCVLPPFQNMKPVIGTCSIIKKESWQGAMMIDHGWYKHTLEQSRCVSGVKLDSLSPSIPELFWSSANFGDSVLGWSFLSVITRQIHQSEEQIDLAMGDTRGRVSWWSKGESEPISNEVIYWSQAQCVAPSVPYNILPRSIITVADLIQF